ncbi:MAG: sigma-70 family RNA polymerase sigma factor [Myxococcales bacterium]|nr:sigma-70 family RNA polymerase sigma factor [Myxococcales bacterium]
MIDALDWADVLTRLVAYSLRRLRRFGVGNVADAEQIAQEAVRRLLDPEYGSSLEAFDDARALQWQLQSIVNGLINNYQRKRATRAELSFSPAELPRAAASGGEAYHVDKLDAELVMRRLRARLEAQDPIAAQLVELYELKPAEQAAELGRSVREIYNARRRLKEHIEAVRRELLSEDHDDV